MMKGNSFWKLRKNNNQERVEIKCKKCGSFFKVKYGRRDTTKYCSRKCYNGDYHSWNNGLTKETDKRILEIANKSSETKKKLFKEGKLIPWSKGKTKENCESLMKTSNSWKKVMNIHPEFREKRRKNALKQWASPEFREYVTNLRKGKNYEEIYGKGKSKNVREKLSETRKKQFKNGEIVAWNKNLNSKIDSRILCKEKHPMYNRHHSEESKIKMRIRHKGTYEEKFGKEKADRIKNKLSLERTGEKNSQWIDGKSFEPYPITFNNKFKLAIKQRDGFMCLKCGMREEDSLILLKCKLHVHHIDYIKENTFAENCCALCLRCNSEVNANRNSWTKFFQSLLSERYDYNYSEDNQIILNYQI